MFMKQKFESIEELLSWMLEEYDKNRNRDFDFDEFMKEKVEELGLSEKSRKIIAEASEYIDDFAKKTTSLNAAREDGITTKRWLTDELGKATAELNEDDREEVLKAVEESLEKTVELEMEQAEKEMEKDNDNKEEE